MIIWLDANLPPSLAEWLAQRLQPVQPVTVHALRHLGLRDASDPEIFAAARLADVVLISKDADFVELVQRLGAPPKLIWLTCGNLRNQTLKRLLDGSIEDALRVLAAGADVVEIGDRPE